MATEPVEGDALGAALRAQLEQGGDAGRHIVERDDGCVSSDSATLYFLDPGNWFAVEASVPSRTQGRVLDIGAGAGRFALEMQNRGHDVVALDVDDLCLEVCRRRGVAQLFSGTIFDLLETSPEPFDTFLLMGHNLGLLAGPDEAVKFLETLGKMANPGARILGTNLEPLGTDDPLHLSYHQQNRERGREPGQLVLRVRWTNLASPWFDYWFLSTSDLRTVAASAGWDLVDVVSDEEVRLYVFDVQD